MEEIVNIIEVDVNDNITFDEDVCGNLTEEYKRVSFDMKYVLACLIKKISHIKIMKESVKMPYFLSLY